jgi:hypothetical protein
MTEITDPHPSTHKSACLFLSKHVLEVDSLMAGMCTCIHVELAVDGQRIRFILVYNLYSS